MKFSSTNTRAFNLPGQRDLRSALLQSQDISLSTYGGSHKLSQTQQRASASTKTRTTMHNKVSTLSDQKMKLQLQKALRQTKKGHVNIIRSRD